MEEQPCRGAAWQQPPPQQQQQRPQPHEVGVCSSSSGEACHVATRLPDAEAPAADEAPMSTGLGSAGAALTRSYSFINRPLPKPPGSDQRLDALLQQVTSWTDFDVFAVEEASEGRALFAVSRAVLQAEGLWEGWKVEPAKMENFLAAAQSGYRSDNPYHNGVHAADVVQAVAVMLRYAAAEGLRLTPLERFAVIIAAVVHDLAHPGLTNDFLINTRAPAALVYNDASVNENYHVACAFRLAQEPGLDVFAAFSRDEYKQLRRQIIGCVLMTDMTRHFELLDRFAAARQEQPDLNRWETRDVLLQLLLHTADISNPLRCVPHGTRWGELITAEFIAQGAREAALGMEVTPTCDEASVVVSTAQLRFSKWFVKPLMDEFRHVSSAFSALALQQLAGVEAYWTRHQALAREGKTHPHRRLPPDAAPAPL